MFFGGACGFNKKTSNIFIRGQSTTSFQLFFFDETCFPRQEKRWQVRASGREEGFDFPEQPAEHVARLVGGGEMRSDQRGMADLVTKGLVSLFGLK